MALMKFKRDIPSALFTFFLSRLPEEARPWASAMMAEMKVIPDGERLTWAVSGSWGLAKIWLYSTLRGWLSEDGKPLSIVLVSAYHAIFSCVLLFVIVTQIPQITSPWTEALFPVLFMAFAAAIPGVIALGLWALDDSARYFAIGFSLLHGLGNYALISTGRLPYAVRPVGRIILDIVIIGVLLSPSVKRTFRPPPIHLTLES